MLETLFLLSIGAYMNVHLGTYQFHDSRYDIQVSASIEPVSPAFRETIGRVYDGGRLRVRIVAPTPDSPNFDLLLENTSEDRWRLTTEVGSGLARILAAEHDRYIKRPFFMTYEHGQYGRLYFEPVSPVEREMGIAFSLRTHPHDPKTTQVLDISSEEDLEAFLVANRVNGGLRWMPNRDELSAAVLQGKADARAVISAQREYEASVNWNFDAKLAEQDREQEVKQALAAVAAGIGGMTDILSTEYALTVRVDGFVSRQLVAQKVDDKLWVGTKHFDSRSGKPDGEIVVGKFFSPAERDQAIAYGKEELNWVYSVTADEQSNAKNKQTNEKPVGFDDSKATQRIEEFSRSFPDSLTMKALNEGEGWAIAGKVALQEGHTEVGNLLIETGRQWAIFLDKKPSAGNANVDSSFVIYCSKFDYRAHDDDGWCGYWNQSENMWDHLANATLYSERPTDELVRSIVPADIMISAHSPLVLEVSAADILTAKEMLLTARNDAAPSPEAEDIARADGWLQEKGQIYRLVRDAAETEQNAEYANDWQEALEISQSRKFSADIASVDGAIITDGKFAGFKLIAQAALGVKSDLVNVYGRKGSCLGYILEQDVNAFVAGETSGFTPEGGWRTKWSGELIDLFDLRGNAADQAYEQSAADDEEFDESANLAAVRPGLHSFQEDSAEFYRWYEYGGTPRFPEPLTREALLELLDQTPNAGGRNLAFPAVDWDRFKDWKLGDLRAPIETLQSIVLEHGKEGPWWDTAHKAADWCRTARHPKAVEIHDALNGLIFRAERDAEANGVALPEWHQQATEARNTIEAAYPREIEASSSSTSLVDAYGRLHEIHALYCKAMAENDTEQAAFERFEAAQIERLFPVLKELVQFGVDEAPSAEATDTSPTL